MRMSIDDYKRTVVYLIDGYLGGTFSRETVWQWAQEVVVSEEWDHLPFGLQDAIHGIWLLHDAEGSWVPDTEELRQIRDDLTTADE